MSCPIAAKAHIPEIVNTDSGQAGPVKDHGTLREDDGTGVALVPIAVIPAQAGIHLLTPPVIPAKAGLHLLDPGPDPGRWIPAVERMTGKGLRFC
jgi:hypothetical protein